MIIPAAMWPEVLTLNTLKWFPWGYGTNILFSWGHGISRPKPHETWWQISIYFLYNWYNWFSTPKDTSESGLHFVRHSLPSASLHLLQCDAVSFHLIERCVNRYARRRYMYFLSGHFMIMVSQLISIISRRTTNFNFMLKKRLQWEIRAMRESVVCVWK